MSYLYWVDLLTSAYVVPNFESFKLIIPVRLIERSDGRAADPEAATPSRGAGRQRPFRPGRQGLLRDPVHALGQPQEAGDHPGRAAGRPHQATGRLHAARRADGRTGAAVIGRGGRTGARG